MSNEIITIEKLAERTIEYLQNDLGLAIKDDSIDVQEVEHFSLEAITALINLKNDAHGTIGLSVSMELAKFMLEQFALGDLEPEEVEELAGETVAEILNVVLGNIIQYIPVVIDGGTVNISAPYIMNKTSKISKSAQGKMYINNILTGHGKVILTFFV